MSGFTSILALCLQVASTSGPLADQLGQLTVPQLEARLKTSVGGERGVVHLYLAATDSAPYSASRQIAYSVLDSLSRVDPSPIHAALLGAAEALQARGAQGDRGAASRWARQAISHMDQAVKGDPHDPSIRVMRIRSLVHFPSLFQVDGRLEEDAAFLRGAGALEQADAAKLMALASVERNFGRMDQARLLWKMVVSKNDASEKWVRQARRFLETSGD